MSTRATIQFRDRNDTFYVYRHCDGFPEIILPDIEKVIEQTRGRWSEPEVSMLVTSFIGMHFKPNERLPDYEITSGFHGDESYRYLVKWEADANKWTAQVGTDL